MKTFLQGSKIKVLVLALCAGLAPQISQATGAVNESLSQSRADALKIVPTLGYSYFNIEGSAMNLKSKSGNSAAVLVQMPMMGGQVELESGLQYLESGAKESFDLGSGFSLTTMEINIKQIAIPLNAKYIFNPASEGTHWFGKAGLTPTYLVGAKEDSTFGGSQDVKSEMNTIGLLTQAGVGADWGVEAIMGRVSLDLTYNYGLTKVFKNQDGHATGYQVQAGYAIAL